jgi:tight adherence protein B
LTSEAKSSAVVLALLPVAVGGIMFLVNRPLILKLFIDPRGRFMLGVAVLSLISGIVAMGVIIKKSLR